VTAAVRRAYEAALAWLLGFSDWERGVGWNAAAAPGEPWYLGRTRLLLDLAEAPDRALRCVLIAGTNGKGSTAAMLEAVERAAGWRTGLYTQPHLHSYRERVRVDGEPISPADFRRLVDRLRPLVDRLRAARPEAGEPTTFELTTVLALLHFAEARVEVAIVEVGLGGRLDATNAVEPVLSVITRIGLDHTQILGDSIARIAREKAGIIRPGGVVVVAPQRPAARRAILEICGGLGARCRLVRALRTGERGDGPADVARARLGDRRFPIRLRLPGVHQRQNAATALAAAEELAGHGLAITPQAARTGLESLAIPGRFEVVPGSPTRVLDAAHNRDSAEALARTLSDVRLSHPRWLVLGILRDKDARSVVHQLLPAVDGIVATAPDSPRALPAAALAEECCRAGARFVVPAPTVAAALERARVAAGPAGTVVATGSFAVVAEARVALGLAESGP
jgi:dihydrofolate synthase / folylpolyglutamate synthase